MICIIGIEGYLTYHTDTILHLHLFLAGGQRGKPHHTFPKLIHKNSELKLLCRDIHTYIHTPESIMDTSGSSWCTTFDLKKW